MAQRIRGGWGWEGTALIAALVVTAAGCVSFHGPERLRRDLSRAAGVELERTEGVTVGPVLMWVGRKFVAQDDAAEIPLDGIRRVSVGVYQVTGRSDATASRGRIGPEWFPGWTPMVSLHDAGEGAMVLLETRRDAIRGVLVVVAEEREWTLVRIDGRLDGLVERVMRMAFDEAHRPDLYEKARAAREAADGATAPDPASAAPQAAETIATAEAPSPR